MRLFLENEIARVAVDLAFKIHYQYGPGMFEKVYENIFCHEWIKIGYSLQRQQAIRLIHDGVDMGTGYIPDLILEEKVILEIKSVEKLQDIHKKQLLTYLKLTHLKLGLLINFNAPLLKYGLCRIVNGL